MKHLLQRLPGGQGAPGTDKSPENPIPFVIAYLGSGDGGCGNDEVYDKHTHPARSIIGAAHQKNKLSVRNEP
jgi:hypothetical protein